jgi:hypothetical protein
MRWMMGVLILVGLLWGMYAVFGRFAGLREEKSPEAGKV